MQYILTQEEYDELIESTPKAKAESRIVINDLCMRIAILDGDGCIRREQDRLMVCDDCPCQDICTHEDKDWSQ